MPNEGNAVVATQLNRSNSTCKICTTEVVNHDRGLLLQKYEVQFFRCPNCGFVVTEEPFWLPEAYATPITRSDVGYVSRNLAYSRMIKTIILLMFDPNARFIDFGGGYGMFVRLMRDLGFDFRWQDKFCENLFARGFELGLNESGKFEVLTAFEVFEHLTDPLSALEEMLRLSDSIVFSTNVVSNPPPLLSAWEYYGLEHGQHIAFYSYSTLREIARRCDLRLFSYGGYVHLLTRRQTSAATVKWQIALNRYSKFLLNLLSRRETLLFKDSKSAIESAEHDAALR
jgi:2-polyprenyl-3-methyl-5-hydroxy-6-metoxy-1,4-benzoquinol methylase